MNIAFIVLAGLVIFVWLIWYLFRLDIKRTENLQKKAMMLGFQFYKDEKQQKLVPTADVSLFSKGHSKVNKNIFFNKIGGNNYYFFDYRFIQGYGKHSSTHTFSVALVNLNKNVPKFFLGPEGIFSKLAQKMGSQDIDFDYNEEFSDDYVLKGENEPLIRKFFNANAVNYLANRAPGLHIEGVNNYLVIYRRKQGVSEIDSFIEEVKNLGRVF